ncbi:MAG: HlyD family type I secretion periplasmic adaptor subunit, partial [Rhizobiales bacterium]|nr:HlyD family type I secretion periplasmic adaptor subunit [Hyphomicrobiales bacterium]
QVAGYLSILVVAGVFGGWSVFTTINGAVIAPATIAVESNTKKIQNKDGGIVREIRVKDGDRVQAGQTLIVLDDTETRAELGIVEATLIENLARRARLEAERDDRDSIEWPTEVLFRRDDPDIARIMGGQQRLLEARNAAVRGKQDQLQQQISQNDEQISGIDVQIDSKQRQIDLIKDELKGLRELLTKGLVALSRVLAMEREQARLDGEKGQLIAARATAAEKIAELKLQIIQIDDSSRAQSLTDLRDAEGKIAEYSERRLASLARLGRTEIKSPIEGEIYQLAVHTIGGVITPAETLLLIVPDSDELVLQAQVSPRNIDQVEMGQKARVRFPALNSRFTPEIGAEVTQVSADTTRVDQNTPAFYAVRLRIPPDELAKLEGKKLKPGMPAEAFIQTSAQTPLTYLVKPMLDQVARAFREK